MKAKIELGMLVRVHKIVEIDVPDDFAWWDDSEKASFMHELYKVDDGSDFKDDTEWGSEEGTHFVLEVLDPKKAA